MTLCFIYLMQHPNYFCESVLYKLENKNVTVKQHSQICIKKMMSRTEIK